MEKILNIAQKQLQREILNLDKLSVLVNDKEKIEQLQKQLEKQEKIFEGLKQMPVSFSEQEAEYMFNGNDILEDLENPNILLKIYPDPDSIPEAGRTLDEIIDKTLIKPEDFGKK